MLHGFTDSDDKWMGLTKHWINLPEVIDKTLAAGGAKEMILVMPNAFTRYQGSMYANSATTGNWEDYVATELVAYVDSHYRTLPQVTSRGLAGHSMGGYGTIRIGVAGTRRCFRASTPEPLLPDPAGSTPSRHDGEGRGCEDGGSGGQGRLHGEAQLASAAAWSPDPKAAPLYLALRCATASTSRRIAAKWAANAPLAMLDQYIANLRRMKAIAFDAGDEDKQIAASIRVLDQALNDYQLKHEFAIYPGNHVNHVATGWNRRCCRFSARTWRLKPRSAETGKTRKPRPASSRLPGLLVVRECG